MLILGTVDWQVPVLSRHLEAGNLRLFGANGRKFQVNCIIDNIIGEAVQHGDRSDEEYVHPVQV